MGMNTLKGSGMVFYEKWHDTLKLMRSGTKGECGDEHAIVRS